MKAKPGLSFLGLDLPHLFLNLLEPVAVWSIFFSQKAGAQESKPS